MPHFTTVAVTLIFDERRRFFASSDNSKVDIASDNGENIRFENGGIWEAAPQKKRAGRVVANRCTSEAEAASVQLEKKLKMKLYF